MLQTHDITWCKFYSLSLNIVKGEKGKKQKKKKKRQSKEKTKQKIVQIAIFHIFLPLIVDIKLLTQ